MLVIMSMQDLAFALMVGLVEVSIGQTIYHVFLLPLKAMRNVNLNATS